MKILSKGTYYGSKKKELRFNGIILSEYTYKIPRTDWHYHENPYFMYLLEGNLYDINKQQKSTCPPGSLLFHNWQEQHYNQKESQHASGFHIEFDRKWYEQQQSDIPLWSGSKILDHPLLHQLVGKLYYEFHIGDEFSKMGIESSLIALCENIDSDAPISSSKTPSWIGSLKEILHERTEVLSLKQLSQLLDVHAVHISRSFPKYFGVSLSEYMRQLKIQKSLHYLSHSKHSLTQIAYLCGFYDQSHFISSFKAYLGMTPRKYRITVS